MDPLYQPEGVEARWQQTWEDEGLYAAEPDAERPAFVHRDPAAERDGRAAHGSRAERVDPGPPRPLPPHARVQHALAAGIRPRRASRRRTSSSASSRRRGSPGTTSAARRSSSATWGWLEHYGGVIYGQFRRLGASLDYRRERFTMDEGYVRAVMRYFVHLYERGLLYRDNRIVNWCPRCASAMSDLEVNHIDDRRHALHDPLSARRRLGSRRDRDRAPADDARRRRRGRASRRTSATATSSARRSIVPVAERRVPVIADERVEPEFGTGAAQDHARPRSDGLRDRARRTACPSSTVIGLDGRMNDEAGRARGPDAGGGRGADRRDGCASAGCSSREEPYRHSVGHCDRCGSRIEPLITLQWWCEMNELAAPAIEAVRGRPRALPSRALHGRLPRLDGDDPPVVRLAPALVGPPDPGLVLPGRAHDGRRDRRPTACARVRLDRAARRTRTCSTPGSRRSSGRSRRSAGRTRRPSSSLVPERRQLDRPRDHLPLGGADDHGRARAHGRGPVPHGQHPLDDQRARRAADVEEPRHRHRSARADRAVRRRRHALRPAQELVDAGRALRVRHDRGGPEAREQALERVAADPPARGGRRSCRRAARARGALDPRAPRRRAGRARGALGSVRVRAVDGRRSTTSTFDDFCDWYAEAIKPRLYERRRGGGRDRARRARAAAGAAPSGHAARDGGDLVAAARTARRG